MYMEVPPVSVETLGALASTLENVPMAQRQAVASIVLTQGYVDELLMLFDTLEEAGNIDKLHEVFAVFKALILLNEQALIEMLLSKAYIVRVIGALEYDPELPTRPRHREFLLSKAKFKQVLPFASPELEDTIHQTFKVSYIKDVVLPRVLDDATFTTLNTLIYFNNVEIIEQVYADEQYLPSVFQQVVAADAQPERIKEFVLFLDEFFSLTKMLQLKRRTEMYRDLCSKGLLDIFEPTIDSPENAVRMASTDIFACVVTHDPNIMIAYLLGQEAVDYPLLRKIMVQLTCDPENGVQTQLTEALRVLLDMESLKDCPQQEEFLTLFYDKMIHILCAPFQSDAGEAAGPSSGAAVAGQGESATAGIRGEGSTLANSRLYGFIKNNVSDLLSFCIQQHGYRCKYFILSNNIASNVLKLALSRDMYLALAAVRFMRAFLAVGDVRYWRYMINNRLFEPIIERFMLNGARDNLYTAAVAELLNFVGRTGVSSIIEHIMTYMPRLNCSPFSFVFEDLRTTAEQLRKKRENNAERHPFPVQVTSEAMRRSKSSTQEQRALFGAAAATALDRGPPSSDDDDSLASSSVSGSASLAVDDEVTSETGSSSSSASGSSKSSRARSDDDGESGVPSLVAEHERAGKRRKSLTGLPAGGVA
ncbi:serine/threonine-protein phosphatase 4 regulatory subunit 3 [Thecamonas trahens ATCC 50062]|uniref:Serine/threonine-protein phosphatase 4 regulatory subunit 3 n=1 Tax=Thecamonas trahens ATCC 50062 TaxID=461836 RepID=A0A0L0DH34_THETB|nr:serine/threonine-protein phosphatase 4 regulatory subunit 3 [Thecamonas trahens ATCC 50062]KNC51451.1 serine/threonine-protein phosphatase 4 regulatory subunit 3 [Thecamonas trahens ATCC 50062]|eukprot:XP_013756113.1 serine/threonine-protein phosphatase 4 regulatory subunit 3 [Thecamonas trahens ATCC 50062]